MAISTNSVWEIRTAGSDTNGGVWDSTLASAGTDFSQSTTPTLSLTDVATTSTTTVTSATGGFLAAHIANGINIAGTVYQITAVASTNSITVDRATGTGTGQTGKVGGACASPGFVAGQMTAGNWVYIGINGGAGVYTLGTGSTNTAGNKISLTVGGTLARQMRWLGYNATRGDMSASPMFQSAGGGGTLFNSAAVSNIVIVDNIIGDGINQGGSIFVSGTNHRLVRCKAMRTISIGFSASGSGTSYRKCEAVSCATGFDGRIFARGCSVHGCTGVGMSISVGPANIAACTVYGNGSHGISCASEVQVSNTTFYNNTGSGFLGTISSGFAIELANCVSYGNGGFGFGSGNANDTIFTTECAAGSNTSGNFSTTINQENSITLTANPFTDATNTDFSLNTAAGGGALLRGTGSPGLLPGTISTGYPDIGAVQHAGSSQFGIVRPNGTWAFVG